MIQCLFQDIIFINRQIPQRKQPFSQFNHRILKKIPYIISTISCCLYGEKKYFPVIVRYFHGNSVIGFDWGYNRAVQGDLKLKFGNNGPYTIILAYLYDEGDTFDKCTFFDKYTVDFDTNLIKQDTKIDSFN